ncbi:hypothetical protein [Corallococcus terminator]|uniref:Uncharacterized protein n=1 Tax=Corallococcus terminator TaxID=2316733 RepID=A0A3A8JPT7_9BACT|nr:hypothetical protein [Corallococcus terminator]RKG93780.1 hypothetical protein D7V88_01330 [Corallococcus terminator]
MVSRLFHVVLLALVTVLGLSFANAVSGVSVRGLERLLDMAVYSPLSWGESVVARRLLEWWALALTGVLLGVLQSRVLRKAGLQASGWVTVTALGLAVGLVGSRALATSLGVSQALAPLGLGVVMGLAQWSVLRREAHGAVVWVAACAVGYGLAGPAAAWGERTRRAAQAAGQFRQVSSISWTAQGMAVVALALCTAIGAAFILASLRTQVLPGPRSRMPGAVAQWAVLGLFLPLLITMEARARSESRPRGPVCGLPSAVPSLPREPSSPRPRKRAVEARPVVETPSSGSGVYSPGCTARGCGSSWGGGFDARVTERVQTSGIVIPDEDRVAPDDAPDDVLYPEAPQASPALRTRPLRMGSVP